MANNFGKFLLGLLLTIAVIFLFAWVVQVTYNASIAVMASGATAINYWQALAFLVLVAVLGSFFIGARGLPVMINYDARSFK